MSPESQSLASRCKHGHFHTTVPYITSPRFNLVVLLPHLLQTISTSNATTKPSSPSSKISNLYHSPDTKSYQKIMGNPGKRKTSTFFTNKKSTLPTTEAESIPARLPWEEVRHEDDDTISIDNLFSEITPFWKGSSFNPNIMNAGTGRLFAKSHHVKGKAAKSKEDFKNGTFGFCLEWINLEINGTIHRVRCLNQFTVKSQQCYDHPKVVFKDGPNRIYTLIAGRKVATYGMIKDENLEPVAEASTSQIKAQCIREAKEIARQYDLAADNEEDPSGIFEAQKAVWKTMSEKGKGKSMVQVKTTSGLSPTSRLQNSSTSVYGLQKTSNGSGVGNATLDAKAKRNPNDLKSMRKGGTKLNTITEGPAEGGKKKRFRG
ncbi:hypothetical protein T440DRAFT_547708 [Plenodomus tracheiphilus IPT5]|uniref:Uncharacterized protein n=1 Tax=Plenodomus tracheiphilus IPT5 TaxID=1408161 RepID=A0A6A7BHC2_9PLEO|nr:hypothetical protein T440DRAFT_547708 [Plenodomus tracheiphilus IPT5]